MKRFKTMKVEVRVCPFCDYEWEPLKKQPKQCPSCKRYLNLKKGRKE